RRSLIKRDRILRPCQRVVRPVPAHAELSCKAVVRSWRKGFGHRPDPSGKKGFSGGSDVFAGQLRIPTSPGTDTCHPEEDRRSAGISHESLGTAARKRSGE